MTQPLPIALAIIQNEEQEFLLVHRKTGDFTNQWGFPGGKIEPDEFIAEAIVREVTEETGLDTTFDTHLGIVSEHVVQNGELEKHTPLHICRLSLTDDGSAEALEDDTEWFSLDAIREMEDDTVPSLRPIAERFTGTVDKRYYESVIEKTEDTSRLTTFR